MHVRDGDKKGQLELIDSNVPDEILKTQIRKGRAS